ncbi:hypothetical protein GCM10017620_00760 [Brevundimonas intermedia]|uniref:Lipoprotein n=1 Tax=Brevundimonas intermedia TaxID=74315 RepID=A0ABQ5T3X4_9CAUL|nr:hypothetical protein GCM10017620_00760 [Brevundimonas intermedia]
MRAALSIGAALLLFGCGETVAPAREIGPDLDCAPGFKALVAELDGNSELVVTRYTRGSNAYRDDRHNRLYVVTLPDHPAHPALFVREVVPTSETMIIHSNGCGFGDQAAFDLEMRAYDAFDRLLNAEEPCYLCSSDRLQSPSVDPRLPPPPQS